MKDLHDPETRITDYATGGEKGAKLTRLGALDPAALIELGRVAGMGAEKYAAFNYLRGYDWSLSFNAMMRHALLFWSGEDTDPESGLNHMAHCAWMALSLVSFSERGLGTDDRYNPAPEKDPVLTNEQIDQFNQEQYIRSIFTSMNACTEPGCVLPPHEPPEVSGGRLHEDKDGAFLTQRQGKGHPAHMG